ncbi:MAG: cobalamin-dependent protein [Limnobacter sp.]|nr:cobalamin-dependent protein [Limnobacter sp.]
MNKRTHENPPALSISAVERDIGLGKDTLRVWEKRYGFPTPFRDDFGERLYPTDQVDKLRVIKRLLDSGHRPGKVVRLELGELVALAEASHSSTPLTVPPEALDQLGGLMDIIKQHDAEGLKQALARMLLEKGLKRFVVDVVAPMNNLVGDAWAKGQFEVFEEHMYTEIIQVVLRNAIATLPKASNSPKVLLTTLPGELHGLGLLMVECMLAIEGANTVSLGTQTPVSDIVAACRAHKAEVLGLSFSVTQSSSSVVESLVELRKLLPDSVEIWCGGTSSALRRKSRNEFKLISDLETVASSVRAWRKDNPAT